MAKLFENLRDRATDSLRMVCGRISPDRRICIIAAMFILLAAANTWITIRGIYSIGRGDRIEQPIEIPQREAAPLLPESDEPPGELELEIEEFFNKHFNDQSNDTTTVR